MKNTCYHHSMKAIPEQSFFSDIVFRYQKDKNTHTLEEMKKKKERNSDKTENTLVNQMKS